MRWAAIAYTHGARRAYGFYAEKTVVLSTKSYIMQSIENSRAL